jgi:hypothetical protein
MKIRDEFGALINDKPCVVMKDGVYFEYGIILDAVEEFFALEQNLETFTPETYCTYSKLEFILKKVINNQEKIFNKINNAN